MTRSLAPLGAPLATVTVDIDPESRNSHVVLRPVHDDPNRRPVRQEGTPNGH